MLIDDRIPLSIEYSILYFKGCRSNFPQNFNDVFLSLKILFILANCADPDEMLHDAAFHLGFHCLPKYQFSSIN